MQYEIFGENLPGVTIHLDLGESVYTQSGGMAWMSDGIEMDTNTRGGLMKGLSRMLTGESLFMATYTATQPGDFLTCASSFPGSILTLDVGNTDYICQKTAFLCAEDEVELSLELNRGIGSGVFGGEGFILQRLHGQGTAFLEIDGSCRRVDLAAGQRIKVNTGYVAAFEAGVRYTVETVKGFKNVLFGGEGMFLTVLEGPGTVWLQTMTAAELAGRILPFMPTKSSD